MGEAPNNKVRYGLPAVIGAAVLAAAVSFTKPQEGTVYHTYRDPGPKGVVTACSGHTDPTLKLGMNYTKAECDEMLRSDLQSHWNGIVKCIHTELSVEEAVAYLDAGFNAGVGAVCGSPMVEKLNGGDHKGACLAFPGWRVKASGKQLPGLVNRRARESRQCLLGVEK